MYNWRYNKKCLARQVFEISKSLFEYLQMQYINSFLTDKNLEKSQQQLDILAMAEKNRQEKKSLCEKSMELMVNIIKLSSFSLATMNLGDKHDTDGPVRLIPIKSFPSFSSNSQMIKSKRSQLAPLSKSYLMEQDQGDHYNSSPSSPFMILGTKDDHSIDDGNFSDYIKRFHRRTKNEVNTDGKDTAYIRRFHEKNSRDYALAASTFLPLALPPPPPPPLKK